MKDEPISKEQLESRFGITKFKLLHTALILREGWEMDNRGWIIQTNDGEVLAFTTSHGGLYEWDIEDMRESLEQSQESANTIDSAIAIMISQEAGTT